MNDNHSKNKLFTEFAPISKEEWMSKIQVDLKGADYDRKLVWHFDQNLHFQPFYMAEDVKNSYQDSTKKDNNWQIRQEVAFSDIESAKDILCRGAEAISLKGFDLDAEGSAELFFKAIDITQTPVHFSSVYSFPKLITKLKKEAAKQSIDLKPFHGSFDFDYYAYYLFRKEFYHSFEANRRELKALFNKAGDILPNFKIINVNGQHYHNSGATTVQELAFTLAHGAEYVSDLLDEDVALEEILNKMQFTLAVGGSYFAEIAKIRAARFLWLRISERFGKKTPIYIHAINSSINKTIYDPHVNILRNTTEGMSAVIGGCDAATLLPFNVFYDNPNDQSKRIARNQQIILKEEVALGHVVDPSAGSYYIENLTESLIHAVWDEFLKIEEMGGYRASLENYYIFDSIEKSAEEKREKIANRKINLLGINQFPNIKERKLDAIKVEKKPSKTGLKPFRLSEVFEELRLNTERFVQKGNKLPLVFLLNIGNLNMRKARANFAQNFFGCAGFDVYDNNGFASISEGMKAAAEMQADFIVLCSSDDEYLAFTQEIQKDFQTEINKIVIAGSPANSAEIKATGIEKFIHARSNVLTELKNYQKLLDF